MRNAAFPCRMLTPPPIARPFGQVDEPLRTVSASSFQKKVGLKISMNGRSATWTGCWAVCAPHGAADAAKVRTAISNEPVDFMMPLCAPKPFSLPEPVAAGPASQEPDGGARPVAGTDVGNLLGIPVIYWNKRKNSAP